MPAKPPNDASRPEPSASGRKRAETAAHTPPAARPRAAAPDLEGLVQELRTHQIELELQNEELRQAQAELTEARDRFSELYDFAPAGYLTMDAEATILEANLSAAGMLGVGRAELIGKKLTSFLTREAQDAFYFHLRALLSGDHPRSCELMLHDAHGTPFPARLESKPFIAQASQAPCSRTILLDETKRRQAEGDLRKSEERIRHLVETAEQGVITLDAGALADSINPKMAQMLGYTVEEMIGRPLADFMNDEGRTILADNLTRREQGLAEQSEYKFRRKDGTDLWALTSAESITDGTGAQTGERLMFRDITKRKLTEEALRESEARYRLLAEYTEDIVDLEDMEGNRLYLSPSYFRKTDWTPPGVLGTDWRTRIHPADLPLVEQARLTSNLESPRVVEHRMRCRDGTWLWLNTSYKTIADPEGRPWRLLIWSHDITERKRAEEALRESEERFRVVFEQAAVGVAVIDSNTGRFLSVNQRHCDITRLSLEQTLRSTYMDITHPDDHQADRDEMEKFRSGVARTLALEKRYLHSDGTITWVHVTVSPMWTHGEAPSTHIAVVEDITARKRTQEALAASEAALQKANENLLQSNQGLESRVAERTSQLRALAIELTHAEERVRLHTADALHEGLLQLLSAAQMNIDLLKRHLADGPLERKLFDLQDCIRESTKVCRTLTYELSPPILHSVGLGAALLWLGDWHRQKYDLTVKVEADEEVDVEEKELRTTLFRAVHELLHNIFKHAGVRHAQVFLDTLPAGKIRLVVRDQGSGFDPAAVREREGSTGGFGLFSLRERIQALGGKFEIESAPGKGSRVTITVPPTQQDPDSEPR